MSGGAFDHNVIDFFVYNETFDERDGLTERNTNEEKNLTAERDEEIPLTRSKMPYKRL